MKKHQKTKSDGLARRELLRSSGFALGGFVVGGLGFDRAAVADGMGELHEQQLCDGSFFDHCSSIIVGKGVTADGSMILAHNEDLGNYPAQHYIHVARAAHESDEYVTTYYGAHVPQVAETYSYTGTTVFDISYYPGDVTSGINEYQVAVVNNASYRRDAPKTLPTDGRIIWTEFTKFALERARTAAEAVEVIGALASRYKLGDDSGSIFGVIDPNEGWWVEVTLEGQWAAQRVSNNTASARANIFRIGVIDFNDTANFKYSDDLVSYAKSQGWYVSGEFNFTKIYAEPSLIDSPYNVRRTTRIAELLEGPIAAKAVDPQLLMRILRDHYEGTQYDLTDGYTKGSPHQTDERTLCRLDTEVSSVIQARTKMGDQDLPADIGAICWRAMGTPCTSIYTPWYLGALEVPEEYRTGVSQFTNNSAYWTARNLSMIVDMRYRPAVIDEIRRVRNEFENREFAHQTKVENTALDLYERDPRMARAHLTRYSSCLAKEVLVELSDLTDYAENH